MCGGWQKATIPVSAPPVDEVEEDATYELAGGSARELADTIINLIEKELSIPQSMLSYLSGECFSFINTPIIKSLWQLKMQE